MFQRVIQDQLLRLAQQYPAITLTGPRQSGKTTLCKKIFPDHTYINLEDISLRQYANEDPKGFLQQYNGKLILDEIQRSPDLPSYLQGIIDQNQQAGQFILTGSQQFEITNSINQSLAGRTAICRLLPLAYEELYLAESIPQLKDILYQGFYPRIHQQNLNPSEALSFYLTTYVERDIQSLINIKDLVSFEQFLRLCAANIGQLINYSKLANDCGIDQKTVKSWLSLLEASYIVFQVQPHFKNFRKRLTKSRKLYFYDIGLASLLLGITNSTQCENHPLKGALFENFIIAELIKSRFNHIQQNNIYFFRDQLGNEVDVILEYPQNLISIEIKSSKTFTKSFLKGIDYYHALAKDENTMSYIIYGGNDKFIYKGTKVYPYHNLPQLLEQLNQMN